MLSYSFSFYTFAKVLLNLLVCILSYVTLVHALDGKCKLDKYFKCIPKTF